MPMLRNPKIPKIYFWKSAESFMRLTGSYKNVSEGRNANRALFNRLQTGPLHSIQACEKLMYKG